MAKFKDLNNLDKRKESNSDYLLEMQGQLLWCLDCIEKFRDTEDEKRFLSLHKFWVNEIKEYIKVMKQ